MTKPAPSPVRPPRPRPPGRLSGGTRDNIIKLRLDDDELAALQAAAEARGYPVARHLRDLAIAESAGSNTATAQALGQTLLICNTLLRDMRQHELRISPRHGDLLLEALDQLLTQLPRRRPD